MLAHGLTLEELEAAACAFAAVLIAFLHAAVAGQVAGVAEFLAHAAGGAFVPLAVFGGGFTEHLDESAGHALADRAGLAGDAAAVGPDLHVYLRGHLGQLERPHGGVAVLGLGEEF